MANYTLTPNMSLIQPTIGQEVGPTWAQDLNNSLSTIDSHDHSSGRGVAIGVAGLSIQADLTLNGNNLTGARSVRYNALSLGSLTASDVGAVFFSGVDLYTRDLNGNTIRLTQSGGIVGTTGSISGLSSPASASYVSGSQTFVWQSAVSTAANMDLGSIILRPTTASANGVTIAPPAGLGASYTLTLPSGVPATNNALMLTSTAGAQSFLSLGSAYQLAQVNAAGTALGYVSQVQRSNLPTVGQLVSSSSGTFSTASTAATPVTNLSVTITTTGRPVMIFCQADGTANNAGFATTNSGVGSVAITAQRGATLILQTKTGVSASLGSGTLAPPSTVQVLDVVAAGTYTYTVSIAGIANSGGQVFASYMVLVAYEI